MAEVKNITDNGRAGLHEIAMHMYGELANLPDREVARRSAELQIHHPRVNDCTIVAEAELGGLESLLTLDADLRDNLNLRSPLRIVKASEFWATEAPAPGTRPAHIPAPGNPLANATWWRV